MPYIPEEQRGESQENYDLYKKEQARANALDAENERLEARISEVVADLEEVTAENERLRQALEELGTDLVGGYDVYGMHGGGEEA